MLGVPYRAFQASPQTGFDCSGLTMWVWAQAGVHIPHQSGQQFATLPHVPLDQAQPGDLVFFYSPISHVGIYIGNGQMIDSPHTGAVVRVRALRWDMVVGVARPG
jgi:cell wall-associated NlpC family hydrolase